MKKVYVTVVIEIDDDIADKYPNFKFNYPNSQMFLNSMVDSLNIDEYKDYGFNQYVKSTKFKSGGKS